MARGKKHTPEQIVTLLRQVEVAERFALAPAATDCYNFLSFVQFNCHSLP